LNLEEQRGFTERAAAEKIRNHAGGKEDRKVTEGEEDGLTDKFNKEKASAPVHRGLSVEGDRDP